MSKAKHAVWLNAAEVRKRLVAAVAAAGGLNAFSRASGCSTPSVRAFIEGGEGGVYGDSRCFAERIDAALGLVRRVYWLHPTDGMDGIDETAVRRKLAQQVVKAGSVAKFAAKAKMSTALVYATLKWQPGQRVGRLGEAVEKALRVRRVTRWREVQ